MNETGPDFNDITPESMRQFVEENTGFLAGVDYWMTAKAEEGDATALLCFQKLLLVYFEEVARRLKEGGPKKWKTFLN